MSRTLVAVLTAALATSWAAAAPTRITFWHAMNGSVKTVNALVDAFNRSQSDYEVVPSVQPDYPTANTKLIAALRAHAEPVLYQSEISFFPRLADSGVLADLSSFEKTLPSAFTSDFYPALWNYGIVDGKRYGLPWNSSTPVLFYNADLFKSRNVKVPTTWAEFAAAAKALSGRGTKGALVVSDDWQFEAMVLTRGGKVVTDDGRPNLNSPEAVDALQFLQNIVKAGYGIPRSLGEAQFGVLDFVRTKAAMVIASIANWGDLAPYTVAFKLGVAPLPRGTREIVPFGGAQLVVMNSASPQERAGAFAFWQFLMRPENMAAWTKATFYVPPRRSVLGLLKDWYAENPYRKTAFEQFDVAVSRPRVAGYAVWKDYMAEAIEKCIKNTNQNVKDALDEAQRRALATK
ncbi:MAG TPA: ABC transporter substrate-binding protein [Deinococcales bacterium]|nr:ABC transporter substrate-binding protein [Deinococcales bacterium]